MLLGMNLILRNHNSWDRRIVPPFAEVVYPVPVAAYPVGPARMNVLSPFLLHQFINFT